MEEIEHYGKQIEDKVTYVSPKHSPSVTEMQNTQKRLDSNGISSPDLSFKRAKYRSPNPNSVSMATYDVQRQSKNSYGGWKAGQKDSIDEHS